MSKWWNSPGLALPRQDEPAVRVAGHGGAADCALPPPAFPPGAAGWFNFTWFSVQKYTHHHFTHFKMLQLNENRTCNILFPTPRCGRGRVLRGEAGRVSPGHGRGLLRGGGGSARVQVGPLYSWNRTFMFMCRKFNKQEHFQAMMKIGQQDCRSQYKACSE